MRAGLCAALCAAFVLCAAAAPSRAAPAVAAAAHSVAALSPKALSPEAWSPETVLPPLLGIPYRDDGVRNDQGEYTLFSSPEKTLPSPGLNCSGFVLAASRLLLQRPISVAEATRDRLGDSGHNAPRGQDWDFGFDLIMNISEGNARALLLPQGRAVPAMLNGDTAPAWNIADQGFVDDFLARVRVGAVYLISFSRHPAPDALPRRHYHVALAVKDVAGSVWLYGTTSASGRVIRVNLTSPAGLARFRHSFRSLPTSHKRLTILEVLPGQP